MKIMTWCPDDIARMLEDSAPDIIIHLAAHVGGLAPIWPSLPNSSTTT